MSLDLAIKLARKNPIPKFKHAAVLVVDGLSYYGYNQTKTHPWMVKYGHRSLCIHAEIDALLQYHRYGPSEAPGRLKGSAIYVARVLKNGRPALSKPCLGCARALAAFGVEHVEWTENE